MYTDWLIMFIVTFLDTVQSMLFLYTVVQCRLPAPLITELDSLVAAL